MALRKVRERTPDWKVPFRRCQFCGEVITFARMRRHPQTTRCAKPECFREMERAKCRRYDLRKKGRQEKPRM